MNITKRFRNIAIVIVGLLVLPISVALLLYPPVYVYRAMVWQESDAFDWQKFPSRPLSAAPRAHHFDVALNPRVEELFEHVSGTDDWKSFLETNHTQAFIVMQDDVIVYEEYFNNTQRDSIVTSFSVAKSFGLPWLASHL